MTQPRVFLFDANDGPCIRSLFRSLADIGWEVHFFRPYSLPYLLRRRICSLWHIFRPKKVADRLFEEFLPLPGFRRFGRLSNWILSAASVKRSLRFGPPDLVVYTMPQYAHLLPTSATSPPSAYFAYDAYRFYDGWDMEKTARLEEDILQKVKLVFVISRQMVEDWRERVGGQLFHMPNATDTGLLDQLARRLLPIPPDLANIPSPIVGCIGHINRSYDWTLLTLLAQTSPEASFVFLGQIIEGSPTELRKIEAVFDLPNVHYLGLKPKDSLPGYLAHFNVCLNPLAVNELNNRRCPLRLYDYLGTSVPVLSTAIREAHELDPYIGVARTPGECVALLQDMLEGRYHFDLEERQRFIGSQTWECRAQTLSTMLTNFLRSHNVK